MADDITSSLAPWMQTNSADPSSYGGLGQLGLNLLANSNTPGRFGSIFGKSALAAQQQAQQDALTKIQMAQQSVGLQQALQKYNALSNWNNPGQAGQGSAGPPQAGSPSGIPQGGGAPPGMAQAANQTQPNNVPRGTQFDVPQGDVFSLPISGHTPEQYKSLQMFGFGKDAGEAEKSARELQIGTAQALIKPKIELLDQVAKSDNAAQMTSASPPLMQLWNQAARSYGINPTTGYNDENIRRVFSARRNELASWSQLGTEAPPTQLKTVQTGLGGSYQVNPVDNKITPGAPQQETAQFMTPDGGVKMMTKAQGMAQGLTPYNPSIYGAANMSDQAVQMAADTYRTTGKMPAAFGRNPLMQAKILSRVAQDAAANGDTPAAIAARSAALKANGQALDQVTKQEAATTSYYNTLDKNLSALQELSGKISSSGVPLVNKVYRAWQQGVSGDPEVAKYVTYMRAAEGEYAKIQSGSLGNQGSTDAARKDAQDVINKYMSQGQLDGVIEAMRGEGQNRLTSIREQKQSLMGGLSTGAPGTAQGKSSSGPQPPAGVPMSNAKGWLLHHDAKGNWAYVSGDGKSFEPVK